MHIVVLGNTTELIIYSDLMQKAGAKVENCLSPTLQDVRGLNTSIDVVTYSSETLNPDLLAELRNFTQRTGILVCDITDGTDVLSKDTVPQLEYMLQAATGLAHTTGFPEGAPTISKVPFIAFSSALYAASFVLAVLSCDKKTYKDKSMRVSRYLTAINSLTTFLPSALRGGQPTRIGNQHPSSSPWNTYPTQDGWILICTSKDAQWEKLRDTIGTAAVRDPQFDTHAVRIEKRLQLDGFISSWTETMTTNACVDVCLKEGIPAGPILEATKILEDPNLAKRQPEMSSQTLTIKDRRTRISGMSLFRSTPLVPNPKKKTVEKPPRHMNISADRPLAGLRVIELGQFTTAPLACRHLANLGADVLKVESPGGEASRHWKPIIDGIGHFFTITNTGKRFIELNLRAPSQLEQLKDEIRQADIVVENMRPDVMGKLGLGHEELSALNPELTLCSISGFGAYGTYPGRAAYDTIVQGISGIMDLTRSESRPAKLGISAADILGAQVALFAILSNRQETGQFIDISMQDVAAYAAVLGLSESLPERDVKAALAHYQSVQEIANSDVFAKAVLMTIPDQNGAARQAPHLPYRLL